MKNCAVAECGSLVRAIASVYSVFFRPLLASFWIGASVGFLLHARLEAAALDHEALDDAVEDGAVVVALAFT